jgi:hypothetical protein
MSQCRYQEFEDFYKFGFVRNPFEMVLGLWDKTRHKHKFNDFNKWVLEGPGLKNNITINIQSQWLDKPIDFVGRYESLEDDWKKIQKKIGVREGLPHVNKRQQHEFEKYRVAYSAEARDAVAKKYKRDLDLYNYDF